MSVLIVLAALVFLMVMAYRGYSVILVAPVAALGAVFLVDPSSVAPVFSGVFMEKMATFLKLYLPVFLLGAVFGKLIEISGFSATIVAAAVRHFGQSKANLIIVAACALMTYGGVSIFVVVFAVYPFAAELYRQNNIPKRLMPGALALGSFSFTMDALPGTPQIQNIIPTNFFNTTSWAAPILGISGSVFILVVGLIYLESRRKSVMRTGEGYGDFALNEPERSESSHLPNPALAVAALAVVGVVNYLLTAYIPVWFGGDYSVSQGIFPGISASVTGKTSSTAAIWAVQGALICGIFFVVAAAFKQVCERFAASTKQAVTGASFAALNTASEYGFGSVIAILPGFLVVGSALQYLPDPLIKAAVAVGTLAGITGSASGGLSIALATMGSNLVLVANAAGIPLEVMHRIVSMASGGMDTLPHNGAIITLLAVTGLTHKQSYREIFGITIIKTLAVFFVIALYYTTGLV
ncbi:GntP family permease [Pseudomonas fluorescens]|uniref:GntP family permease n=1 Tax=Pseudomonas fluorescens TaxID=294 RepID=UPI0017810DB8|nr:GntP family permease [Pseudomonas fluorescens]MBD8235843.1 GntP family permease [Pseudomonas fluorescens]MDY0894941.1 GntP family permease [Pseudomonas fluorescens]